MLLVTVTVALYLMGLSGGLKAGIVMLLRQITLGKSHVLANGLASSWQHVNNGSYHIRQKSISLFSSPACTVPVPVCTQPF